MSLTFDGAISLTDQVVPQHLGITSCKNTLVTSHALLILQGNASGPNKKVSVCTNIQRYPPFFWVFREINLPLLPWKVPLPNRPTCTLFLVLGSYFVMSVCPIHFLILFKTNFHRIPKGKTACPSVSLLSSF